MDRTVVVLLLSGMLVLTAAVPPSGQTEGPSGAMQRVMTALEGGAATAAPVDLGQMLAGVAGGFMENRGQVANGDVRFYAKGDRLSVGLTPTGVIFTLRETRTVTDADPLSTPAIESEAVAFRLCFVGCSPTEPRAAGAPMHKSSFYIGNEPARWLRGVASHSEVVYEGLYPGIDLRFLFNDGALKYEFVVAAGADADAIRLRYEGVESLSVDAASGEMLIGTPLGVVRDARPVALQSMLVGTTASTPSDFNLDGDGSWGFALPDGLDHGRPYIIDPGLQYFSYLGGTGGQWSPVLEIAEDGGVYVSTIIYGEDFPNGTGTLGPAPGMLVLCKLDSTLKRIVFSTFFGGTTIGYGTWLTEMHVRKDGNVVITGRIDDPDFPTTPNAIQRTYGGGITDGVIAMLSDEGELLYSSFFGTSGRESSMGSCLAADDSLYVVFNIDSPDFPTTAGAYCRTFSGGIDNAVCKFDPTLTRLELGTLLGGSNIDDILNVLVDADGNVLLSGGTMSEDFPFTTPPPNRSDFDVYILRMKGDFSEILTCVGISGDGTQDSRAMTVSANGTVFLLGDTDSSNLLVKNPIQGIYGGNGDTFVAAYDPTLESMLFLTYVGGSMSEFHEFSTAWDLSGEVLYIAGVTESPDFPVTKGCYDATHNGALDLYVYGIDTTDFSLAYSTYIGGSVDDYSFFDGLAMGGDGHLVLAGVGDSPDLPCSEGAIDTALDGWADVYIIRLDPSPVSVPGPIATARIEGFGDGFVNVSWDKDSTFEYAVTGYKIYRGPAPEFEQMRLLADVGTNLSYNNTDLVNGREYFYRVTVVNGAGEGPPSEAVLGIPMDLPGAPVLLPAATGNGTVSLTWLPPQYSGGRIVGYRMWRGMTDACPDLIGSTGEELTFIDTNVTPGAYYYYRAQAYNELGGGNLSEYERIKAIDVPSAPLELVATGGAGEVVLTWKAPASDGGSPLLGYSVYRGTSFDGLVYVEHLLPGHLTYRDARVVNGTTYYYRVNALSGAGLGGPSEVASAMPYGPPGAVGSVSAVGGDGSILVEWAPPPSDGGRAVTGYNLYAGPAADALTFLMQVAAGTSATHAIENGVTWYFSVSAVNEVGEGPVSAPVWATAMGEPSAPTQLRAQKLPGAVVLSWARPTADGGSPSLAYRVLKGASADALAETAEVVDVLSWTDTDVELGGTYYYSVLAVNLIGAAGPRTDAVQVYLADVPGAPANLTAVAGDATARLTWASPTDDGGSAVLRYIILRGATAQDLVEVATVSGSLTEYLDLGLRNTQTYHYAVQAENDVGAGAPSAVVTAVPMPPPGRPVLKVELKDDDVVLTWTAPTGETAPITGYIVYRGPSRERLVIIAELGLVLTYTDEDFERGKVYYYSVSAVSGSGEGAPADPVRLKVEQGVPLSTILIVVLVIIILVLLVMFIARGRAGKASGIGEQPRAGDGG